MKLNFKNKWRAWLILPALIIFFWALPTSSFNLKPLSSASKSDFLKGLQWGVKPIPKDVRRNSVQEVAQITSKS